MTSAPVRAVTVDLDDTLFPQEQWLAGAWLDVADRASALGLDGERLLPELFRVAGQGSDRGGIIDGALAAIGVQATRHVTDLVAAFTAHRPARLDGYPGALAALDRLRAMLPVIVVTDGLPAVQRAKLAALGLDDLPVVVSDELGGRHLRKPDPAPFRRALELLDLPAENVVHIGDRPAKDVVGARGVGMRAVRVRTGEYAGLDGSAGSVPAWRETGSFATAVDLLLSLVAASGEHRSTSARL